MTIFESINRSQSLIQKLSHNKKLNDNTEITGLLSSLTTELENINLIAHQLTQQSLHIHDKSPSITKPDIESGCYIFTNEKGFFCPHCYDNNGDKIPTTRLNSKIRVCPACRTSIK